MKSSLVEMKRADRIRNQAIKHKTRSADIRCLIKKEKFICKARYLEKQIIHEITNF